MFREICAIPAEDGVYLITVIEDLAAFLVPKARAARELAEKRVL